MPYWFCRTCPTCMSQWDSARRAFPRTVAQTNPQSGKGHAGYKRRAIHEFTPPRELLSGLSPYTSTGKRLDAEASPFLTKPKTKTTERAKYCQRNHLNRWQAWPPKQRTYANFKSTYPPRGTIHRATRSRTASDADHEDQGIRIQHSCRGNLSHLHPRANLVLLLRR
ncbi:hypothetical protein CRG98_036778 [Punica granatum]|uniref:Uncharacterized protein n=1 Tax=Punica granatum TaxID=22663 RepID=A0A2I0IFS1_PUNGR|nr:hypothetical protein CRG98_036778 [Punica granatum]